MNYTKPEVAVLGQAAVMIEMTIPKRQPTVWDGTAYDLTPAYDLDE
jgi:hypothetical protein